MSEKDWTDEQNAAINHKEGAAVVSAGAGSGKTAVLVERVLKLICDEKNPADPSKSAVVTFTEKAASELKTRLFAALKEQIKKGGNASFLRSQSNKLKSAKISTISSFCFSLIRENIELTDFPAGFSVIDETKSKLMKSAVADSVLEEFFTNGNPDEIQAILENYTFKDERKITELIIRIANYALNQKEPQEWLDLSDSYKNTVGIRDELLSTANRLCGEYREYFGKFETVVDSLGEKPKTIEKYKGHLSQLRETLYKCVCSFESNGYVIDKAVREAYKDRPKPLQIRKAELSELKKIHDATNDIFKKLYDCCERNTSINTSIERSLPAVRALKRLAGDFIARYSEQKRLEYCADFSDAERGVYRLLCEHPEVREKIGLQYIIVDEFQDSNYLQYEIFSRLSDNLKNLYFVGDIKQSIYGFRGAQPDVFDEITHNGLYKVYPLNTNFRSSPNVINGINTLFCRMMTKKLGGVDYAEEGMLVYDEDKIKNRGFKEGREYATEVLSVVAESGRGTLTEARYIAGRIRSMIDGGFKVFGRPCCEDDFAIIMRSPGDKTGVYMNVLREAGLNSVAEEKEVFTERTEIKAVLDFLRIIDNPYNDVCLARLLMGGIYCFDAERMSRIRTGTCGFDILKLSKICPDELKDYAAEMSKKPLFTCLSAAAGGYEVSEEKYPQLAKAVGKVLPDAVCAEFTAELEALRAAAAASSPSQLIRALYDTTFAANLLLLGDDSDKRRENLELLLNYAESYTSCNGGAILGDFLDNIDIISTKRLGLACAKTVQPHGVRIMTIHGSKGLQFPVVFVSDCAHTFNSSDFSSEILLSDRYGICVKSADRATLSKIPSPAYSLASDEKKREQRNEEMRLLYVAATRAEEKLIFTGVKANGIQKLLGKAGTVNMKCAGCEASNCLDWLFDAMSLHTDDVRTEDDTVYYESVICKGVSCDEYGELSAHSDDGDSEKEDAVDENISDLSERLTQEYKYILDTVTPAKYTATELAAKQRESKSGELCFYAAQPSFMQDDEKRLTGKKRGDAYHKLMEHIPFEKQLCTEEISDYISNRTADFLSDAERECIDAADIERFFDSDVSKRMIQSGNIYREYPIFHRLTRYLPEGAAASAAGPYVQGIADMFFIEDGRIILVDYKSDRFTDEQRYIEDYKLQLDIYSEALQKVFNMPVAERYIYSFRLGKAINIDKYDGDTL